jgi:hypothetical protein
MMNHDVYTIRRRLLCSNVMAIFLLLVLSVAAPGFAQDSPAPVEEQPAAQPTVQNILSQQVELRAQIAAKRGAFKDMHASDRERLLKQQDRLLKLLEDRDSIEDLRVEERVEVFNTLQAVNAAVKQAEDDRQICERSRLVGSHRYQVVCMSAKQYRDHKENAQKSLRTPMKCQGSQRGDGSCGRD